MEEKVLKYSRVNVFVDDEGREIHEISPANYTDSPKYAASIPIVVNEYGVTHPIRLIIRNAKNVADAFLMHDSIVAKLQEDMAKEMSKPKLVMAGEADQPNKIIL